MNISKFLIQRCIGLYMLWLVNNLVCKLECLAKFCFCLHTLHGVKNKAQAPFLTKHQIKPTNQTWPSFPKSWNKYRYICINTYTIHVYEKVNICSIQIHIPFLHNECVLYIYWTVYVHIYSILLQHYFWKMLFFRS